VLAAINATSETHSYEAFRERLDAGTRSHDVLFPFAFMQIKKTGGAATAKRTALEEHARSYGPWLNRQLALYDPDLIIGCGLGGGSPARLLRQYVLTHAAEERHAANRFTWWRFADTDRPRAMLEFYHPSARGSREKMYRKLVAATREIVASTGLTQIAG
jgi:uracil-DNA glycosylase